MKIGEEYVTRSGQTVYLHGVSSYYLGPKEISQFIGLVDGQVLGSWDADGNLLSNYYFGSEKEHPHDIVDELDNTPDDPGLYYFEFKKEVTNGKRKHSS
jgi:hypothetical protein